MEKNQKIWPIWTCGIAAIVLMVCGCEEPQAQVESEVTQSPESAAETALHYTELEPLAKQVLRYAHSVVMAEYDVENAEHELAEQVTAGAAQLKAMRLTDTKEKMEKANEDLDRKMDELVRTERAQGKSGFYSGPIQMHQRRAELDAGAYFTVLKSGDFARAEELSAKFWADMRMGLDEVMAP